MRGWLAGLVEWIYSGKPEGSSQILMQELEGDIVPDQWVEDVLQTINAMAPGDASPRLRAYLESQIGSATFTPWAIFRD